MQYIRSARAAAAVGHSARPPGKNWFVHSGTGTTCMRSRSQFLTHGPDGGRVDSRSAPVTNVLSLSWIMTHQKTIPPAMRKMQLTMQQWQSFLLLSALRLMYFILSRISSASFWLFLSSFSSRYSSLFMLRTRLFSSRFFLLLSASRSLKIFCFLRSLK